MKTLRLPSFTRRVFNLRENFSASANVGGSWKLLLARSTSLAGCLANPIVKLTPNASWLRSTTRHCSDHLSAPPKDPGGVEVPKEIQDRILTLCQVPPSPLSLTDMIDRGSTNKLSEEESFYFLNNEMLIRLSHLIIEMQHFPKELRVEEGYKETLRDYLTTYTQLSEFHKAKATPERLKDWASFLQNLRKRHKDVVPLMAQTCMDMKKRISIQLDNQYCGLAIALQYGLNRLYLTRISLNVLADQHLILHGYMKGVKGQIGMVDPKADIAEIVKHAYRDALFLCEQLYLIGPKLELRVENTVNRGEPVLIPAIPSHVYYMAFELMKNSMQATVDRHLNSDGNSIPAVEEEEDEEAIWAFPKLKVIICYSTEDLSIRIEDIGGGVDAVNTDKMFLYLYTTAPRVKPYSNEIVPLSGLGYGLPLSQLHAVYMHGEVYPMNMSNHGMTMTIFLTPSPDRAVEWLPLWSKTALETMQSISPRIPDWTFQKNPKKFL